MNKQEARIFIATALYNAIGDKVPLLALCASTCGAGQKKLFRLLGYGFFIVF
jgi:hypothetical protein